MSTPLFPVAAGNVSPAWRLRHALAHHSWTALGHLLPPAALPALLAVGERTPLGLILPESGDALCGHVPLARLEHRLHDWFRQGGHVLHTSHYFRLGGDWAPLRTALDASPVVREARQLFATGFRFHDMPLYAHYCRRAEQGSPVLRSHVLLDSRERIDAYFGRYTELFRSVQDVGLQHRFAYRGLRVRRSGLGAWKQYWAEQGEQEIGIAIDHDGTLCRLPGGQHRTAVARVLGLSALPVQVRLVHSGWLKNQSAAPPWLAIRQVFGG